ncbi:MFS transporter [Streptacidiphilus fuscans]|uniref:MFS transporter n=1 Tax=Streptacidiphilus fuscans TaxID=2789292 RepID=A0A931B8D1_9ACTN|nr:MFS transporter [Streptacidiphilus fuscans]MBF9072354.1 MFS transporter [Streptacidiphilus fuscans]
MASTTLTDVRGEAAPKHGSHAARGSQSGSRPGSHTGNSGNSGHSGDHQAPMSHRQIMEALSGLMLGMFVAVLSSTIVSTALPTILSDIGGGQSAYTWIVTAALLAVTATTPLWGKMSDLVSKKLLVQIALVLYIIASVVAGFSQNPGMLIACRVVQGIGAGGLSALSQVIMAAMISPRERGRYSGYLGATFAVATVGGPLIGGVITDTSWLGWRWCFYVVVPFALIALVVLQKTIHLPVVKRQVKVDWLGAFFVTAAVCLLMVWVTLAGDQYAWLSWQTYVMVPGAVVLGLIFLLVESKASEPLIPLRLFRNKTITLTSFASLFVGVGMFAGTVFLSQYFQLGRGKTPTMSGVMTIPLVGGLFVASMLSGQVITRTGRWKAFLVAGGLFLTGGAGTLGLLRVDTPYWQVAIYMALLGIGIGLMMQNLVLAVQNQVAPKDLGAASSLVTFFRSLGGALGVVALGAALTVRITHYSKDAFAALGLPMPAASGGNAAIPDLSKLPPVVRSVTELSYGHGIGDVFLYAAPFAFVSFLLVVFIKEVSLKTTNALQQSAGVGAGDDASAGTAAVAGMEEETASELELVSLAAAADVQPAAAFTSAGLDPVEQEVPMSGSTIHGSVRGGDGRPVGSATVTLISLQGQQLGRATVAADGAYRIAAPGAGSYVLIAAAEGYRPQASTVAVGDNPLTYDIALSGTSGLTGLVRAAADQRPVAEAMVVVTDLRGEVLATGKTAATGAFTFEALSAGTFTVAVNATGFRPAALPVEVGTTGPARIEIELAAGLELQGTVRAGAARRPLVDARVTLVDMAGNVVGSATTGEEGDYAFSDLDAGDYTLIASGYPPVASSLTLDGRGALGHDVELGHSDE